MEGGGVFLDFLHTQHMTYFENFLAFTTYNNDVACIIACEYILALMSLCRV